MGATGLAANPAEYRDRLQEQSDEQIDSWAAELMRDVAARRGVAVVIDDLEKTAHLDDRALRRIFAAGGGPPAVVGRDPSGRLFVPAVTLHCFVSGMRAELPDAKERLVGYLVANFDDLVYV